MLGPPDMQEGAKTMSDVLAPVALDEKWQARSGELFSLHHQEI